MVTGLSLCTEDSTLHLGGNENHSSACLVRKALVGVLCFCVHYILGLVCSLELGPVVQIAPDFRQAASLKKMIEDKIAKGISDAFSFASGLSSISGLRLRRVLIRD